LIPDSILISWAIQKLENVKINKTLTLIGEDRNTTIIDGSGSGDVVAHFVFLGGFLNR